MSLMSHDVDGIIRSTADAPLLRLFSAGVTGAQWRTDLDSFLPDVSGLGPPHCEPAEGLRGCSARMKHAIEAGHETWLWRLHMYGARANTFNARLWW